jgi:hypothetical protein
VIEEVFAIFEDLCALREFPEEGATRVVLITCKLDTEREGSRQDCGWEMTTTKGIDSPTVAQNLLRVARKFMIQCSMPGHRSDCIKISKFDWGDRKMGEALAVVSRDLGEE